MELHCNDHPSAHACTTFEGFCPLYVGATADGTAVGLYYYLPYFNEGSSKTI